MLLCVCMCRHAVYIQVWMYVSVTSTDFVCTVWSLCVWWGGSLHAPWESWGRLSVYEQQWQESPSSKLQPPAALMAAKHSNPKSVCGRCCEHAISVSEEFEEMTRWKSESKTRNVWVSWLYIHTYFNKIKQISSINLPKIHSIFPTDWRDAPECVRLHPHRRPSGVQTPAPLGHVSSTAPGDVGAPG